MSSSNHSCPAMRYLWHLLETGDKELMRIYHHSHLFNAAFSGDVPIKRLIMAYESVRERMHEELMTMHLRGPQVIQLQGADPAELQKAKEARDQMATRLTDLVSELQEYLGRDFGTEDPDKAAVDYLKGLNLKEAHGP